MKVVLIAATTVCGRISPATMGSTKDRRFLESMRSDTDASLIGAGTLRQSDPEMRCIDGLIPENRIRAIVSDSGDIPIVGKKIFSNGPQPFVFTNLKKVNALEERLSGRAKIFGVKKKGEHLDVQDLIKKLEDL